MTTPRCRCLNPLIYGAWFWLIRRIVQKTLTGLNPLIYGAWFWPLFWMCTPVTLSLNPLIYGAWFWQDAIFVSVRSFDALIP